MEKQEEGMQVITSETSHAGGGKWIRIGFMISTGLFLVTLVALIVVMMSQPDEEVSDLESRLDDIPVVEIEPEEVVLPRYAMTLEQVVEDTNLVSSQAIVHDPYWDELHFSLDFPPSWGFVSVVKQNLTDNDTGNVTQLANFKFTSEFRPEFQLIINTSLLEARESDLVTQAGRVEIGEGETIFYQHQPNLPVLCSDETTTEVCLSNQSDIDTLSADVATILESFEILAEEDESGEEDE